MKTVTVDMNISPDEANSGTRKILKRKGRKLEVTIPAGIKDGQLIKLSGALMKTDQQYGNIFVRVRLHESKWPIYYAKLNKIATQANGIWVTSIRPAVLFRLLINILIISCIVAPFLLFSQLAGSFLFVVMLLIDIPLLIWLVILVRRRNYFSQNPGVIITALLFLVFATILSFASIEPFKSYKDTIVSRISDVKPTFSCPSPPVSLPSTMAIEELNKCTVFIVTDLGNDTVGLGSGVIYDRSGYIVTNAHVIEGAKRILVFLYDGQDLLVEKSNSYEAQVIKNDKAADLAIIKINYPGNLPQIILANSSGINMRDKVYAVGYPDAHIINKNSGSIGKPSQVPGEVSRTMVTDGIEIIQVSCPINPGNSGGALVNANNELIGIIFARGEKTSEGRILQGQGYAVSISRVRNFIGR